ncbi:MAG: stage V sporulation protein E, partial [Planctomycetota bacterium]
DRLSRFWKGLFPAVVAVGAVSSFVVLEDLGTGVLMAAAAGVVLVAAGARLWQFALFIPFGLLGVVAAILQNPYRMDRIVAFLNPYADPQHTGFHMIQSMATVAGGGFTGRGLGHGLQKFGYLPEDQTDFLFAIICEELGVAGALFVLALYALLAWTMLAIVRRERSTLLRLGALGIIATFTLQASINLMVVTGLGPTKGIALPLLSAGGTGWILTAASLGLLVAIDRRDARVDHGEPSLAAVAT